VAGDGDWRTAEPAREHHCNAVEPPSPLALDKQRRLCLTADHLGCATYLAAERSLVVDEGSSTGAPEAAPDDVTPGARASDWPQRDRPWSAAPASGGPDPDESAPTLLPPTSAAGRWPMPRTAPTVIDRGGFSLASWRPDRPVAQFGLVVLMVLAFVVLAVARLTSDGRSATQPSPPPSAQASAAASSMPAKPSPAPSVSPSAGGSAEPSASVGPGASAAASPTAYRVKSGDTLTSIAARFGTSVAILRELNGIADPSLLRVGQLLKVP
jgi:LysM repeat protein